MEAVPQQSGDVVSGHVRDDVAIANFMASLDGLTLHEALANIELDAGACGWSRTTVRTLASRVRTYFAAGARQ
jgi:hypothetical protein